MYNVYLLDDEPFILEGLKYIVPWEEYGFNIVGTANNGLDGFNEIVDRDIDLVITDIMMPKMTGLELIENLKKENYDSEFIVLSAFQEFDYAKKAISMGAENYILKPIDTEELISSLEKIYRKNKEKEKQQVDNEILSNNKIYKFITKAISEEEFNKNIDLLNLDRENHNKSVAVIEFKNDKNINKIIIDEVIKPKKYLYCTDIDSKIIILINEKDNLSIKEIVNELSEEINKITNDIVYISLGKKIQNINDIHISYNTALDIHEYKTIYPEVSWIRIHKDEFLDNEDISIDFEGLKKILVDKNFEDTLNYVENMFNKLKENETISPKKIHLKYMEIFLYIYNYFNDSKIIKGLSSYLESVMNINTVDEIKFETKKMVKYMQSKLGCTEVSMSPVILKLLNLIETKYNEDLNLKEISDKLNINPIYLGQLFQKETGVLFSDYINNFRVNKAKTLLIDTNLKASDIGELVGYANKNYFYRKFKDIMGITPSEWRKINIS